MIYKRTVMIGGAVSALACLTACAGFGGAGTSGAYPSQEVTIVVPYSAGGPTDLQARALAPCLEEETGQTFVVVNRAGGGGVVGASELAAAEPDGYTLGILSPATAEVAPLLTESADFTGDDFTYAGMVSQFPAAIMVTKDSPFDSVEDLVEQAKEEPGSVSIATGGASTTFNIALQQLAEEQGVPVKAVPFEGGSEAQAALLGGNADALFALVSESRVQMIANGDLKALAVGTPEPVPFLEGVPTMTEAGYEQLLPTNEFFTLAAPAGTPNNVMEKVSGSLEACLEDEQVVATIGEAYVSDSFAGADEAKQAMAEFGRPYEAFLGG